VDERGFLIGFDETGGAKGPDGIDGGLGDLEKILRNAVIPGVVGR
jgi:hypothetical protein